MTAANRARELEHALGLSMPKLNALREQVEAAYSEEAGGVPWFAAIPDELVRARVSDWLAISLDGAREGLLALALRQRRHLELLGPNGRTMPLPDSPIDDQVDRFDLDVCATDCFRAAGSALDCIAAAAILLACAPLPAGRAHGGWLLQPRAPDKKHRHISSASFDAIVAAVQAEANSPTEGWLAWTLETRNAVVHRGPLIGLWLPRPGRKPDQPKLLVATDTPIQYLARLEPHLRAAPWLGDMDALVGSPGLRDLYLGEPAHQTLAAVVSGVTRIVETVSEHLLACWRREAPSLPVAAWGVERPGMAAHDDAGHGFRGFDQAYPVPPIDLAHMHPSSAKRAVLANRLRPPS